MNDSKSNGEAAGRQDYNATGKIEIKMKEMWLKAKQSRNEE